MPFLRAKPVVASLFGINTDKLRPILAYRGHPYDKTIKHGNFQRQWYSEIHIFVARLAQYTLNSVAMFLKEVAGS